MEDSFRLSFMHTGFHLLRLRMRGELKELKGLLLLLLLVLRRVIQLVLVLKGRMAMSSASIGRRYVLRRGLRVNKPVVMIVATARHRWRNRNRRRLLGDGSTKRLAEGGMLRWHELQRGITVGVDRRITRSMRCARWVSIRQAVLDHLRGSSVAVSVATSGQFVREVQGLHKGVVIFIRHWIEKGRGGEAARR